MRNFALSRITPYVKKYWVPMTIAILLGGVEILFETRIPLIEKAIIDGPLKDASQRDRLLPLVGLLLVLGTIEVVLASFRRLSLSRVALSVETDMRNDLYNHLQSLPVAFHDGWQTGQLLSRAMQDINSIRRFVGFGLPFLIILTFQFFYVISIMFRENRVLAAVVAITLLPVFWVSWNYSRSYRGISRKIQDAEGDLGTTIEEAASGIRIIKAFGRGPRMLLNFKAQAEGVREAGMSSVKLNSWTWPTFDIFPQLAVVEVLLLGGLMIMSESRTFMGFDMGGRFTSGGLVAFISLMWMLVWPLDALGWILGGIQESRTACERIWEVLDTEPDVRDAPDAVDLPEVAGRLSMRDVWFRYEENRDWVLKGVNLEIEPGETLALVGTTGCGKTTLAMLIPRLYEAQRGEVALDNHDVTKLKLSSLRSHVGVAFEDPILFSASVRENLIMGRPDATEEEIASALKTAQAEFVYKLPFGLETRVGEQGHTLSGGQRQRLALARAVLGRPQVLVLDDPLSAVDVHTEAMIEEALETVLKGVTAILVVHRPSTLALADRVALMDEGKIVAVGIHHELMDSHPLYRAVLSQEAEEMEEKELTA